jgi:hypothetical protein
MSRLLTLREAAAQLNGKLTAGSLRRMARQGRLQLTIICGKHFVTQESLDDMVVNATLTRPQCLADASPPDSTCAEVATTAEPPGSSWMDRKKLALEQAQMIARQLKQRSKPTSPATTARRVTRTLPPNSSSPR